MNPRRTQGFDFEILSKGHGLYIVKQLARLKIINKLFWWLILEEFEIHRFSVNSRSQKFPSEHILLLETCTQESVPTLHKIRKYLVEATEEASLAYNKAVTRLREYQGVDPHFDTIAKQYQDMV